MRRYHQSCCNGPISNGKTFETIGGRLGESSMLKALRVNLGQQKFQRTATIEDEILDAAQILPNTNTKRLVLRFDVSSTGVWRKLCEKQLCEKQFTIRLSRVYYHKIVTNAGYRYFLLYQKWEYEFLKHPCLH